MDYKKIEKLLQLAKQYKLAEFELEENRTKIRFTFKGAQAASVGMVIPEARAVAASQPVAPAVSAPPPASMELPKAPVAKVDDSRLHKVLSPFVGTFYRAPSPEADSYVKDGQVIRKGDVLCIVEAMKLMNEIESEVSGKVISILVENGQAVEYGEPLFLVEPM